MKFDNVSQHALASKNSPPIFILCYNFVVAEKCVPLASFRIKAKQVPSSDNTATTWVGMVVNLLGFTHTLMGAPVDAVYVTVCASLERFMIAFVRYRAVFII